MEPNYSDDRFLARWLNGDLTPAELELFEQHPDYPVLKRITEKMDGYESPDFPVGKSWEKFQEKLPDISTAEGQIKPLRTRRSWIYAAAASLLLLIGLWFLWKGGNSSPTTYYTEVGQQKELTLPSGSVAFLNAKSSLSFSTHNWEKERRITLEGEAYFEVEAGAPFRVETEKGVIEVLGTHFSVNSRANWLEVQCFEGRVRVRPIQGPEHVLPAGQSIQVDANYGSKEREVEINASPTWLQGISQFSATPLWAVLGALERQFGIEIDASQIDTERLYTGSFVHDDVETALKMVLDPFGYAFDRQGQRVLLQVDN